LFSLAALERDCGVARPAGAAEGFGAGATVVFAGVEDVVLRHAARILLSSLVQSIVVEVVFVVVFTAPGELPAGVSLAAVRHAGLFALPAFVQS
jgi:hypothetical protein